MKTLTDLKRELGTGRKLILKTRFGKEINEGREVVKVQLNGVWFKTDANKKSWFDFPKASLLKIEGQAFKVYNKGRRPLTDKEKAIRDGRPVDKEQDRIDMLSDGSTMYWRKIKYYTEHGALYLMGHKTQCGMRYDFNSGEVWDAKIRGAVVLEYVLTD